VGAQDGVDSRTWIKWSVAAVVVRVCLREDSPTSTLLLERRSVAPAKRSRLVALTGCRLGSWPCRSCISLAPPASSSRSSSPRTSPCNTGRPRGR